MWPLPSWQYFPIGMHFYHVFIDATSSDTLVISNNSGLSSKQEDIPSVHHGSTSSR